MTPKRPKKCPECGDKFQPTRQMQPCCDKDACREAFAIRHAEATRKRRQMQMVKAERIAGIEDRKVVKIKLAKLTPGYLEDKAQGAINSYVRARDHEQGCISCDKGPYWHGQWQAGHLKTRGSNSFLRYSLHNINKQCSQCNKHGGNVAEHERGIVARYGQERLDYLLCAPKSRRYSDEYLIRLAKIFRKRTRIIKKRKGIQ